MLLIKPATICVIGQVIVDVFDAGGRPFERLGGVFHAVRGLRAAGIDVVLCWLAPIYLAALIREEADREGVAELVQVGTVDYCPNLLIVGEPTEAGPQRYYSPFWDRHVASLDIDAFSKLRFDQIDACMIFAGGFDIAAVLGQIRSIPIVHADVCHGPTDITELRALGRRFNVLSTSTSTDALIETHGRSSESLVASLAEYADAVLFKENRGGARLFSNGVGRSVIASPAHVRSVIHSVGIGDCFDAVFMALRSSNDVKTSLGYASFVAAEYACTFGSESFHWAAKEVFAIKPDQMRALAGISLPWEERPRINIYIAAPDFAAVDTSPIDALANALTYHNFSPRRPVREFGEVAAAETAIRKREAFAADLEVLDQCQILVAVMLYDDPGTLIEIGLAAERGLTVIVFDPFHKVDNVMLVSLPQLVSTRLDDVIAEVFRVGSQLVKS